MVHTNLCVFVFTKVMWFFLNNLFPVLSDMTVGFMFVLVIFITLILLLFVVREIPWKSLRPAVMETGFKSHLKRPGCLFM